MKWALISVVLLLSAAETWAAQATATLSVTATLQGSLGITIESAGGTLTGGGTSAASTNLGTVSKYGSAPAGFTLTRAGSSWTLSSTIGIKANKANMPSSEGWVLYASLSSNPASGVTWMFGANDTPVTTASTMVDGFSQYNTLVSVPWKIQISDSAAATSSLGRNVTLLLVTY